MRSFVLFCALLLLINIEAAIINFETDIGGLPDDDSLDTCWRNGGLMNITLGRLVSGDVFLIPNKTFYLMGGIIAAGLQNVTIQIDGTLSYSNDMKQWPRDGQGNVLECMQFDNIQNVTFTSSGTGLIDGNGEKWWGVPGLGYIIRGENRPRLFNVGNSSQILVENIIFQNSPYWTFWVHEVDGLEVRFCDITARRTTINRHDLIDLSGFNTDGFDVTGKNVWIHDSTVWNQDDCFCVKDGSENMLFERVNASGVGLTIGSISGSVVRNITFRDVYMMNTYKGIYMKFRAGDTPGLIADVLYENIFIESPEQWPIWIGPAQQSDSGNLCNPNPCSLCWPTDPLAQCNLPASGSYQNITLRNITISNPKKVGVIMANGTNPMTNITFDGVRVVNFEGMPTDSDYFKCEGVVNAIAMGDTWPVPPCFQDNTTNPQIIHF
jgi:hypothetical protein